MHEILNDYLDYCCGANLIPDSNAKKYMRVQPTGESLEFDIENNLYIVRANREFRPHCYLGLYKNKSVRAVGKVVARIAAIMTGNHVKYDVEYPKKKNADALTDERKEMIDQFFHEYHLENDKHRFFFVEKFYETDFKKISKGGLQSSKIFNLTEFLKRDDIPDAETLAKLLKKETWA